MKFIGVKDKSFQDQIEQYHEASIAKLKDWLITVAKEEFTHKLYDLSSRLTVDLSMRLAVCAGKAMTRTSVIKLNYRLHKANPDQLIATYGHELAHLVARMLDPFCDAHGRLWKSVMGALGLTSERCHDMDVAAFRRPVRRYEYACKCRAWFLTQQKHNRSQRFPGSAIYFCRACKDGLVYKQGPVLVDRSKE